MRVFRVFFILFFMVTGAALLRPRASYSRDNPFGFITAPYSAGSSEDVFASIKNPSFSGIPEEVSFGYRYFSFAGRDGGDHFGFVNAWGFSFFYGWLDHVYAPDSGGVAHAGTNYFNINKGIDFDVFSFGIGYSFTDGGASPYGNYRSWSFGVLLRPVKYVSFGYSLSDFSSVLNGEKLRRKDVFSLALRPAGDRLTLSADAEREEGEKISDMNFVFGAEFRFLNDTALFVKTDTARSMRFGMSLPLFFTGENARTLIFNSDGALARNAPGSYSLGFSLTREKFGNAPVVTPQVMLVIDINGTIKENAEQKFFGEREITHHALAAALRNAGNDRSVAGIVLKIGEAGLGFAQIQELRAELKELGRKGTHTVAVMEAPGNREYYLASACKKIYFTPNSLFYLTGLSAEVYFFKGLLDRAGIRFESVTRGKYKSFNESFSREHMSGEFRENLTALLANLNDQFTGDIASDRNIDRRKLEELFARGGITAGDAVAAGFIDGAKYPDDAIRDETKGITTVTLKSYMNQNEKKFRFGALPVIAVVYLNGSIISGKTRDSDIFETMGDESYERILALAFDRASAVVIRIDSGGGSASASDFMLNSLVKIRKKRNIPVVFSFGNMAASGGYYVACSGDRIFADRATVTGSIGVVTGKISARELYEKLGIHKDVIKMSEFADIFSESRELTARERDELQKGVDFVYDRFTEKVIAARKIEKAKIPEAAEGRVFTGTQAMEKSLVDEFGGLIAAVEYAKTKSGIDGICEIREYPERVSYLPELNQSPRIRAMQDLLAAFFRNAGYMNYGSENVLYLFPYRIEIK